MVWPCCVSWAMRSRAMTRMAASWSGPGCWVSVSGRDIVRLDVPLVDGIDRTVALLEGEVGGDVHVAGATARAGAQGDARGLGDDGAAERHHVLGDGRVAGQGGVVLAWIVDRAEERGVVGVGAAEVVQHLDRDLLGGHGL